MLKIPASGEPLSVILKPRFEGAHYSAAGKPGLPVMSYAPPLRRLN